MPRDLIYCGKRDRAAHLIIHYFRTVFEKAGAHWDSDNEAELADFVDYVIDASVYAGKESCTLCK